MHKVTLPDVPGRTVVSVQGTCVRYLDADGQEAEEPLSTWLDRVPPYKSMFPYGNKVMDEAAECAHLENMRFWRGVVSNHAAPRVMEAEVTVNGVSLSQAQVTALRTALASASGDLRQEQHLNGVRELLDAPPPPRGPQLASPPKFKRVLCRECGARIEYLPEHVERHSGIDYGGGPDGYERVKCPRHGCAGYGYISTW